MNYSISIPQYLPRYIVRFFIGAIVLLSTLNSSFAQTDTEFWFVVPDITIDHSHSSTPVGGVPASLKFSSSNFAATVTISMPAGDPAIFPDIIVELAPYDFQVVNLNCWIVDLCNPPVAGAVDVNQLENKALTPEGINNFGLHITSTAPITAYYEVNNRNNKDIWALKGRNGLGTEFFTPFQNQGFNGPYTPQPISSIDIVSTEDGTDVTFTLPPGKGASYGVGPETDIPATPAGSTFTVTLDRGQTFSLFPLNRSTAAANRLAGTKIESSNPIAVTLKDDSHTHLSYGCRDVSGDQLIPTKVWDKNTSTFMDLIGREYIAIRTGLYDQDNLFILPVEDNTNIRVYNPAGAEVANVTRNARQQYFQPLPDGNAYYHIVADKPVYVMHIGGFGCEVGAAILPPIEKCTGVPRVAFARTSTEDFYVVIMVRQGAEDGFEFDGVERDDIFPPGSFIPVPNSEWSVARFGPISQANAAVGTHFMRNTKDIFHLGIVNGGAGTGCFYGYFSDYNEFNPETLVIETGSEGGRICSGQTLSLYASGGTKYEWSPATYLDDPTSETPTAYNIESSINYEVTISGACNTFAIRHVNLQVGGPVTASFDSDFYTACATPPPLGDTPRYTFNFTSTSTGDAKRWWSWQLGETGTSNQFKYGDNSTADDARSAILTLENNTDQILEYHVKLRTSDDQEFCFQEVTKIIRVYPYIDISAARTIVSDPNCQPLTVNLTGTPSGNFNGATYKWDFGDGNSAPTQNATNIYNNTAPPYNSIDYFPEVTITDKWNVCTATDNVLVTVPPYLEASFTANPVSGCSPLQVNNFSNTSKGVPADGFTWKLYRLGSPDVEVGSSITGSPPDISSASTLLVNNRTDNLEEVYRLDLEVTNASGCLKTYSQEFTVYPNPTATVSIDDPGAPDINCSPLQIDLSASTIRNTNSFQWLVDGVSRLSNPDPIGSPPANYTGSLTLENITNAPIAKVISYKATNNWGCDYVAPPLNVNVQPHIHSEIVLNPEVICPDSETGLFDVQILDAKIVADGQYEWLIDGVSQGIDTDIGTRTFDYNTLTKNANGEAFINLQLVVENAAGCIKTDNQQIKVNPQVSVDFDAYIGASLINPGAGGTGTTLCPPETLDFTSSTTYANSYQWKFGGLKEATTQNASLDVENNGSSAFDLPVTLTASNSYGCSGTVTKTYTIEPEVITNFDIESLAGCAPFTLDVSAVDNGTTYNWEFVGQNRTGADQVFNPVENKTGVSLYETITLEAVRGNCTLVKNDVVVTIYPEVQAQWDFTAPTDYCAPVSAATFDNTSDLYAGGSVTNIQWQVFDGATLVTSSSAQSFTPSLPNTSHTAQKTYDVHLTATSADGCVGQVDDQIIVNPNPLARFNASITDACTPLVLDVVDESVTKAGSTYTWDWDGGSANDENANPIVVTYNNNTEIVDPKHINLHIQNEYGCISDYDYLFEVFPQVNASFSVTRLAPNDNCGDEEFTFTNTSTAGASIDYYEWSFGTDKLVTTSTADFNRSFTAHGTDPLDIPVSVRAYSSIGCINATPVEQTITVFPQVVAAQSFDIGDICDGDVDLTLANTSSNVGTSPSDATTDFLWTFTPSTADGTLTTSSGANVNLTNGGDITPVVYNVDFVAETQWDYNGITRTCRDAITGNSVTVYPNLDLTFDIPDAECSTPTGVEITFARDVATSSGGDVNDISIAWDFGDGNTASSNFDDVTHTFTNISNQPFTTATKFTATQLATGCTFEDNIPVTVYPTVTAAQSFILGNLCRGEVEVTLANASSNTGVTTGTNNFEWRFTPDDLTNGAPANFTSEGSYSLVNNGSIDPVTYSLEFFAETVWNEGAADHKSCSDVITPATQVKVYPELLPVFLAPDAACSGQTGVPLTFVKDNTASKGGNPADVTIEWNFGDGNTQSSNFDDVTHTFLNIDDVPFTTATEYTATQLATGCTVTDAIPVTVYPRVTAAQSFTLGNLCGGEVEVTLANASSNIGVTHDDATNYFSWVFTPDDDINGTEETFTSTGTYQLTNIGATAPVTYDLNFMARTVWNEGDVINEKECAAPPYTGNSVVVYPELIPEYDIPPAVCSDLTGATLEFNKSSTSSGGGEDDVSLIWDFGDGNTRSTGFVDKVTKKFENLSDKDFVTKTKFFATQLATGCTYKDSVDVRVHPKVESIFTFEIDDVCEYPLPVTFANASKYSKAQTGVPTEFIWDYGYDLIGNPEGETLAPINGLNHTYAFYNDEPNQIQEYIVSLIITQYHKISDKTCDDSTSKKIQVYPEMLPSFNLPTTEGCNPLTVSFENNSTGVNLDKVDGTPWNGQFVWDLGNGSTSSSITPATREYGHADKTQSHIYNISLTATNPLGCVKEATTTTPQVTVYPWVESWFTVDRIEGCTPLDVTLSNTFKSDEYAYLWNFVENGTNASTNSSDLEEPGTITFTNPLGATDELLVQKPQIQLKTSLDPNKYSYQTDEAGCVKTATPIEVSVFPHVYPDFEATLEGCHPLEDVEFTNTSNVFGETNNGEYTWDFDNGVQSNVLDPTQTFRNPDFVKDTTFNVKLTAESQHGCIDDTIKTVTVYPKPKARIELEEYMGCSPFDLAITNSSVGKGWGSTLEFTFDFGDASDPYVTTDPADPASANHEYRNLNNEIEPYTLWLTVETENECTDETSQTIHVYPEVTARFDTEEQVYEQCNPFEVQFENTSTNSWSYLWNFDDGGITSSSVAPNYRFVNNDINDRTYDVTLTAMSEFDCEDTDTLAITVFAAPIVDFVIMPPHQVFPQDGTLPVVYFKNLSRPKGIPHTWPHKWTFGDGDSSISTEETIEHTYEHWGPKDEDFRYEVTLAISNEKCADTLSQKFTILPPEPISLFSANEYRACSPLEVNFYNESLFYLTDEDATAFEWRIDGEEEPFSTAFEPRWTFTEPGYYNVQLTVYGDGGEKHSYRTFRVYENPKASFEAMPERVTLPNARVHFYNFSERADSCIWVFGDNSFESNDWDPVHTYTEMGEYRVTLTAFSLNDDGTECVDIYSKFPAVWVLGSGRIRFPNAFVPSKLGSNGGVYDAIDYKNEVFHPVSEGVMEYRLQIFNRWGEQIFESNDINIGWDGYYKGKLASQGVYVWRAVGRFANGDMFDKRGNVTLLR